MGIWNYMLATGNRLSTALNVHIKDIDFDNGNILMIFSFVITMVSKPVTGHGRH